MSPRVWLLLLAGCGRLHFDPIEADASPPTGPFGSVTPFEHNSAFADDDPALSSDGLELIFDSERAGIPNGELYVSTRADRSSPWSAPVVIPELSSPYDEDGPAFSPDGLVLFFASERPAASAGLNLWMTTRTSRTSAWVPPTVVAELNSDGADDRFAMTADQLDGVYSADRATGNGTEIYEARRSSAGATWNAPTLVAELDTTSYDGAADIDPTGLVIVFSSSRAGSDGLDLWTARRVSRDQPFANLQQLTELDTSLNDQDPCVSADGHTIAFVRGATPVDRDIFFAQR